MSFVSKLVREIPQDRFKPDGEASTPTLARARWSNQILCNRCDERRWGSGRSCATPRQVPFFESDVQCMASDDEVCFSLDLSNKPPQGP